MAAWEHDSHQIPDDEFLSDGASTFERDVAPIGAEPTELITDEVPPAVSEKNDSGSFVGRVLELKAWAVAASKISFYHDFSGKKKNPLFALIQEYSKTPKNDPGEPLDAMTRRRSPLLCAQQRGSSPWEALHIYISRSNDQCNNISAGCPRPGVCIHSDPRSALQ